MPIATTIHLIRHAAYDGLGERLTGRAPGVSLNAAGRNQAATLADTLSNRPIRAIISSPLARAQETAAPIASALGLDVITRDGFIELDFGDWTGLSFAALHAQPAWAAFNRARTTAVPPGAKENLQDVQARALKALAGVRAEWPDDEVVIVSHGDVIRSLLAHALAMPFALFQRLTIEPGSRSVIVLGDDFVRVDGINLSCG
jgi:broad specificity phosphatase PhoE